MTSANTFYKWNRIARHAVYMDPLVQVRFDQSNFCPWHVEKQKNPLHFSPKLMNPGNNSSDERTKYKGVRKRKWGKWVSEIRLPNSRERIWLGSYDSPERAARAFDAAQFCLRGRLANFNFPETPPEIPGVASLSRHQIQIAASKFANEYDSNPMPTNVKGLEEEAVLGDSSSPVSDRSAANLHYGEMSIDWSMLDALNSNDYQDWSAFPLSPSLPEPIVLVDEEIYFDECWSQPPILWNFDA